MAGQPRKRAMLQELERRTREAFEDEPNATHLDYAESYIASGHTLLDLANEIAHANGDPVMYETLRRYLHSLDPEKATARLTRARASGAFPMTEYALQVAENAQGLGAKEIAGPKLLVDTKLRVAEMFNRAELGQRQGATVNVNLDGLFLDALRQPVARQVLEPANVAHQLPSAPAEEIPVAECVILEERNSLQDNDLG